MKKKLLIFTLLFSCFILLTGCDDGNLKMTQEEIINVLYDGIASDDMFEVANTEITSDNIENYLGDSYNIESGIASEPLNSSIAHSIVVVKLAKGENVDEIADKIESDAKASLYRKWVCVEAEEIEVETFGNTVILIMTDNQLGEIIEDNLDKIK